MMLQDIDSDEIDESGVESGNNSDSEAAESLNAGNSETSDSNSHHASTTETVPSATIESERGTVSTVTVLPWGAHKERCPLHVDVDVRPGEFVMRSLFTEFTTQAERKIESVLAEPQEKQLFKVLQRGEDAQFDQLLSVFGTAAEHCLPSILKALFAWYDRQMADSSVLEAKKTELKGKTDTAERTEADAVQEKRDLAVEFILCLVLIEVLKQLPFHPGHEDLVTHIENLSFRHFKYREGQGSGVNAANFHTVADLYAEVLGALAQSRFLSVKNRFLAELKELRAKEPCPFVTQSIISLLMGMKFFRVKMVPIEEFEASFQFMQECAQYFLEVKDKDIKHALAGLFVEILVPVAASVKNEVNVPCLKNFVESLYTQTLDMCTKSKHRLALFPLVTCLLCVSQKIFFLQNLHTFLTMCLQHLKNRDPKMSRVALESLYRLLWVYMIRIKCESNSATQSRLQSIVNSLFPKGSKAVVPRDTPLNIFVKIIQFIAQERLDFAMREIVFDLLSVGRPVKVILTPERMSIGLRAFLVVADSLQQKEGEPPMPRTSGVLPSGNTLRVKKTFLNKMLTEDTARSIGMSAYFPHVRRVFVDILRALDTHYGRPLMMTSTQNVNKEPDEMITGERKPRIDLFRTCVAAVPRLIPDGITSGELVDLLARLTVHLDEELRGLAYQSLQTLVIDFPDWRHDVVLGFTQFLSKDVPDTSPQLLDNGLRMLLQLLTSWKNSLCKEPLPQQPAQPSVGQLSPTISTPKRIDHTPRIEPASNVLHLVEGFAIVMLCSVRLCPRRLSVHILREAKILLKLLGGFDTEEAVIDVMESWLPIVLESCLHLIPATEKTAIQSATVDIQWLVDRSSSIWTSGIQDENSKNNAGSGSVCVMNGTTDPWATVLFGLLERGCVLTKCLAAINHCWPIVYTRLHMLFTVIDPTPVSDNRASLLRSSAPPRRPVTERDMYLVVWRNYASLAMRVVPPAPSPVQTPLKWKKYRDVVLSTGNWSILRPSVFKIFRVDGIAEIWDVALRSETYHIAVLPSAGFVSCTSEPTLPEQKHTICVGDSIGNVKLMTLPKYFSCLRKTDSKVLTDLLKTQIDNKLYLIQWRENYLKITNTPKYEFEILGESEDELFPQLAEERVDEESESIQFVPGMDFAAIEELYEKEKRMVPSYVKKLSMKECKAKYFEELYKWYVRRRGFECPWVDQKDKEYFEAEQEHVINEIIKAKKVNFQDLYERMKPLLEREKQLRSRKETIIKMQREADIIFRRKVEHIQIMSDGFINPFKTDERVTLKKTDFQKAEEEIDICFGETSSIFEDELRKELNSYKLGPLIKYRDLEEQSQNFREWMNDRSFLSSQSTRWIRRSVYNAMRDKGLICFEWSNRKYKYICSKYRARIEKLDELQAIHGDEYDPYWDIDKQLPSAQVGNWIIDTSKKGASLFPLSTEDNEEVVEVEKQEDEEIEEKPGEGEEEEIDIYGEEEVKKKKLQFFWEEKDEDDDESVSSWIRLEDIINGEDVVYMSYEFERLRRQDRMARISEIEEEEAPPLITGGSLMSAVSMKMETDDISRNSADDSMASEDRRTMEFDLGSVGDAGDEDEADEEVKKEYDQSERKAQKTFLKGVRVQEKPIIKTKYTQLQEKEIDEKIFNRSIQAFIGEVGDEKLPSNVPFSLLPDKSGEDVGEEEKEKDEAKEESQDRKQSVGLENEDHWEAIESEIIGEPQYCESIPTENSSPSDETDNHFKWSQTESESTPDEFDTEYGEFEDLQNFYKYSHHQRRFPFTASESYFNEEQKEKVQAQPQTARFTFLEATPLQQLLLKHSLTVRRSVAPASVNEETARLSEID